MKFRDKIAKMESDIEDIIRLEKEEKAVRASENQVSVLSF